MSKFLGYGFGREYTAEASNYRNGCLHKSLATPPVRLYTSIQYMDFRINFLKYLIFRVSFYGTAQNTQTNL